MDSLVILHYGGQSPVYTRYYARMQCRVEDDNQSSVTNYLQLFTFFI